ncbi:iron ABC transporter permease [Pontibacillus chungwhensis BH030062]|uniref:Iron ABC transporter permease n=1 Tax=Pontibacillus chungwhensis BH030062 TaxID=1385513 RepID=A0A0A2UNC6_9BACI|nr:iron ABC transporter permease [Pontibacillus chungwhensis]KGP89777.1 iron ABC transporter permease [Pontibacillus chungwhensis BH030062]
MSKYVKIRSKKDRISFFLEKRALTYFSLFLGLLCVLFIMSASLGETFIPPFDAVTVFFGGGTDVQNLIIETLRLPRIIVALFVGIGLALSGAILQGMIRNPLASPDIIGISGGGAVAVVLFLTLFSDETDSLTVSIHWMPVAAFIGASLVGIFVYLLAYKNGVSPMRIILIGIGLSALTQAITNTLMIVGPIYRASQANVWLTGSVYGANWEQVKVIVPSILVLVFVSLLLSRRINVQELGEELAAGVGSHLQRDRFLFLLVSTALAGIAVSFAGGVGFVGLMAPHIARRLVGSSYGALLPLSGLIGAILVIGADLIGRTLFLPNIIPAGVFTATIGAPYFIFLLFSNKRA